MIQSDMALFLCRVEFFFYYAGRVEEFLIRLLLGGGRDFKVKGVGVNSYGHPILIFLIGLFRCSIKTVGGGPTASHFFQQQKK